MIGLLTRLIQLAHISKVSSVFRHTSNATMWGDTGRYPLAKELSSQVYGYLARLEKLHSNNKAHRLFDMPMQNRKNLAQHGSKAFTQ